jgi:hypothetical protein
MRIPPIYLTQLAIIRKVIGFESVTVTRFYFMSNKFVPTLYQLRRYTLLFHQYCKDIEIEGDIDTNLQDIWNPLQVASTTILLRNCLDVDGLAGMLSYIGPLVTSEQAYKFIVEYDSTFTGTLKLSDFLGFFQDFIFVLYTRRNIEINNWNTAAEDQNNLLTSKFSDLNEYLAAVGLDDPDEYLNLDQSSSDCIAFSVEDQNLLCRNISVHVFSAYNLENSLRYKHT